ncbi:MAG: GAF domain-containing protein, partial [candidate division WOR-3 bacterium]|nr:GAF domain-containing protein [candidate division WOR-3 bacterium]
MNKIFKDYYCFILPVVFTGVKLLTDIEAGMTIAVILSAYIFASMLLYILKGAQNIYFGLIPGSAALAFIFLPAFHVHIILLPLILMIIPAFLYRKNNTFACCTAAVILFLFVFVRDYFDLTVSLLYLISAVFVIITVIHNAVREKKSKDMEKQIEYYNAKKNIIDISPFALNKSEVLRKDSPATLRIMNHISSAIETIIEIIARSVSVKSIVYIVYDRKEDKLFPEKAVSSEDIILGRPLDNRDNALYWVIETGKDVKDNLYVGDPQKLGFYRGPVIVKSVIIVPVKLDDRITGLIYADSSSENHFTDSDYQLINLSAFEISRLLSFAKYAQNSKKDAAYFSLLNDIVAKLAETLDFREITDIAVETINQIIDYDYCSVVQCSESQYRIITQSPDRHFKDGELDQHSFISMVNDHSGLFVRENILERDIPVYYLNKHNHDKKINAMIGFPFLSLDKSSVCLIAGIK